MKELALISIVLIAMAAFTITASFNIPEARAALPAVTISKVYDMNQTGSTFVVNITVSDVSELGGWGMNLSWNPAILKINTGDPTGLQKKEGRVYVNYSIHEGDFMRNGGSRSFTVNAINNTAGTIKQLASYFTVAGQSVSGSGILATINFTLLNTGTTAINITGPNNATMPYRSVLADRGGGPIDHVDVNGLVTDQPEPPPPPIWSETWFQALVVIVVVLVVVPTVVIVRLRSRPPQSEEELKRLSQYEEKEVEGIPLPEDSEKKESEANR